MKILFLAPQPFFQERGTPIAVRLALEVLSTRKNDVIDLLSYHEGRPVNIPNVTVHRIRVPWFVRNLGPGISFAKLFCDLIFFFTAFRMVWSARKEPYQFVHAVEESVFMAFLIRFIYGIPYLYDMDSSLVLQLTEKWYLLRPLRPLFEFFERLVVRSSTAVIPVCDALAVIAKKHGSTHTEVLSDISLLGLEKQEISDSSTKNLSLKHEAGIIKNELSFLYVGNLEAYQGIDLLLRSFAQLCKEDSSAHLIIIGGNESHRKHYQKLVQDLGICMRVHFLGPKPLSSLSTYLPQADILVSPRIRGNNTPMKIYSYLHSGKPLLATLLPTHTQVIDDSVAKLALPQVEAFAKAMLDLIQNAGERDKLGKAAKKLAEDKYTFENFRIKLHQIYDLLTSKVVSFPAEPTRSSSQA